MKVKFYAPNGCPIISARATGSAGSMYVEMPIDTGASYCSLSEKILKEIGAELENSETVIVSATSFTTVNTATVQKLDSLGLSRSNIRVIVLDLPEVRNKGRWNNWGGFFQKQKVDTRF